MEFLDKQLRELRDARQRRLDEFACAALTGLIACAGQTGDECRSNADKAAFWAYEYADAMLADGSKQA